jgi:hypothetical protein
MPTFETRNDNDNDDMIDDFLNYVTKHHCKCTDSIENSTCYGLPKIENHFKLQNIVINKKYDKCNIITIDDIDKDEDYLSSARNIIITFEKLGYISQSESNKMIRKNTETSPLKSDIDSSHRRSSSVQVLNSSNDMGVYFLTLQKKQLLLNWGNIKRIKDQKKQMLFWYFRKAIVDCLIKHILVNLETYDFGNFDVQRNFSLTLEEINSIKIFAVGSVKLTSDYDLTIYSNPTLTVKIIQSFRKYFNELFHEESYDVFDTNIYGKGFVEFREVSSELMNYGYKIGECDGKKYFYIRSDDSYNDSQLMWGLLKFIHSVKTTLGDDIYNQTYYYFNTNLEKKYSSSSNTHLKIAQKIYDDLNNKLFKYENVLEHQLDILKNNYTDNKIIRLTDYISLVNFFGIETYYTKGAFMDIVINNQTCKNSENKIKLEFIDYLNSIIENASFFFLHNEKDKYLLRVFNSLKSIKGLKLKIGETLEALISDLDEILIKLKIFNKDKDKICSSVINLELSKYCIKPEIYEFLLKLVYKLIRIYLNQQNRPLTVNIPFKNVNLESLLNPKTTLPTINFDSRRSSQESSRLSRFSSNSHPIKSTSDDNFQEKIPKDKITSRYSTNTRPL